MNVEEILSKAFHPLVLLPPTGLFFLILNEIKLLESLAWISLWITIALIPTAFTAWNIGEKSFDVNSRDKRYKAYITGIISALSALTASFLLRAPPVILKLGAFGILVSTLFGVYNYYTKISVHTGTLGFITGSYLSLNPLVSLIGLIILPSVGWSRIKLGCHTRSQVIQGAFLGLITGITAGLI